MWEAEHEISEYVCMGTHAFVHSCSLALAHDHLESQTLTYVLPVSPRLPLSPDSTPKTRLQANKFHYNSPKLHSFRAF